MKNTLNEILEDFKNLKEKYPERFTIIIDRIYTNLDNTQNAVIKNRILIASYSFLYLLAVMGRLNLSFINQYLNISKENPFFTIESVEKIIIMFAPLLFSLVYYLLMVSKFHRGILHVVLNKIFKNNLIVFGLLNPYSSGGTRGFFNKINNEEKTHKFNKFIELYYYILVILISIGVFTYLTFRRSNLNINSFFLFLIIILTCLFILYKTYKDIKKYKKIKTGIEKYNFID
jgi:hypothetical protein